MKIFSDTEILDFLQKCSYSKHHEGKFKNFLYIAFDKDLTLREAVNQILNDVDEKTIENNLEEMKYLHQGKIQ